MMWFRKFPIFQYDSMTVVYQYEIFFPEFILYKREQKRDMTRDEIKKQVIAIIVDKLGKEEKDITENSTFVQDLGADSLDIVELIMEFEKVFNLTIPDEDADKISTVGDAINYIETRLKDQK